MSLEKCCTKCGCLKSLSEYYSHKGQRDGRRPDCKACVDLHQKRYRESAPGRARIKNYNSRPEVRQRANDARRSEQGKESYWRRAHASPSFAFSFALYRALKRCPTEDAITHSELMEMYRIQDGCCAITGIKMTWQRGGLKPNSMTMDKIVPELGYASGNIRLICHAVNMFRGRMSDDEMFTMALAIVANIKKPKLRLVS